MCQKNKFMLEEQSFSLASYFRYISINGTLIGKIMDNRNHECSFVRILGNTQSCFICSFTISQLVEIYSRNFPPNLGDTHTTLSHIPNAVLHSLKNSRAMSASKWPKFCYGLLQETEQSKGLASQADLHLVSSNCDPIRHNDFGTGLRIVFFSQFSPFLSLHGYSSRRLFFLLHLFIFSLSILLITEQLQMN